ncbi:MAG: glutaredoxin family protein [Gammaproteobacteria bacterium]|nr:glutaredoxin family protein [Gammaproteobacteria bacterium]MDH3373853.1 glutaredoxin family protein [Gammaproteobacteria bacterium]MDH3408395.1 glutaredoxin family protein [Gammaproteobacteria bacterium]MDH3551568.1 glutaredoxin family protein [Gammaproteobacteria bacterium]
MKSLAVFSRRGCHLCEQLIEELLLLVHGRLEVSVLDIDSREDWKTQYDTRVPVVEYDGELICQYHLDRDALTRILSLHGPNS